MENDQIIKLGEVYRPGEIGLVPPVRAYIYGEHHLIVVGASINGQVFCRFLASKIDPEKLYTIKINFIKENYTLEDNPNLILQEWKLRCLK
jgi:hypothetical protein